MDEQGKSYSSDSAPNILKLQLTVEKLVKEGTPKYTAYKKQKEAYSKFHDTLRSSYDTKTSMLEKKYQACFDKMLSAEKDFLKKLNSKRIPYIKYLKGLLGESYSPTSKDGSISKSDSSEDIDKLQIRVERVIDGDHKQYNKKKEAYQKFTSKIQPVYENKASKLDAQHSKLFIKIKSAKDDFSKKLNKKRLPYVKYLEGLIAETSKSVSPKKSK